MSIHLNLCSISGKVSQGSPRTFLQSLPTLLSQESFQIHSVNSSFYCSLICVILSLRSGFIIESSKHWHSNHYLVENRDSLSFPKSLILLYFSSHFSDCSLLVIIAFFLLHPVSKGYHFIISSQPFLVSVISLGLYSLISDLYFIHQLITPKSEPI